jgi:hypothetical protein
MNFMAKTQMTAIEKLFRDLTELKPKAGEERSAFLERLLKAGQEIKESVWKKHVPEVPGAEDWYNDAAKAWSAANDAADIPEPVDAEEDTGDGEEAAEQEVEETGEAEEAESDEQPEEPEAEEVEEETAEADPEEQVEEETVTMPKTATARKPVAKAPAKVAKRAAPVPAKRAAPPAARKAAPAKAVPAKKVAAAPAKKVAAKAVVPAKKPKPQVGSTSFAKRLLCDNPNQSVGELRAAVDAAGISISDVTLSTIRADFRHSLRVLMEAGMLKKNIRLE